MMFGDCSAIRAHLGAFVDGELPGAEMLRVRDHLDLCPGCQAEIEDMANLGGMLRDAVGHPSVPPMAGLASGVISRVRAERATSWRAMFERAIDDWHWAIVGLGSVTATSLTTLLVASVLWFGPEPVRQDSLAAMLTELSAKDTVFIVREAGQSWDRMALRVAEGAGTASMQPSSPVIRAAFFPGMSGFDLAWTYADMVTRNGRMIEFKSMREHDRLYAERLIDELNRIRTTPTEVILVSSTTVSAKGL